MFVNVKYIERVIDKDVKYLTEAVENHENVTEEEYRAYLRSMRGSLLGRLEVMKFNSTDRRLIDRYSRKVGKCVALIDNILEARRS